MKFAKFASKNKVASVCKFTDPEMFLSKVVIIQLCIEQECRGFILFNLIKQDAYSVLFYFLPVSLNKVQPIFIRVLARIIRHIVTVNYVENKSIHCFSSLLCRL